MPNEWHWSQKLTDGLWMVWQVEQASSPICDRWGLGSHGVLAARSE